MRACNIDSNYRVFHNLPKKICIALLLILLGSIITACADEGVEDIIEERDTITEQSIIEEQDITEEQNITERSAPTFLDLEYMYSIEDVDLSKHNSRISGEFTWYHTYGSHGGRTFEDLSEIIYRNYDFELPEYIYLDSNSFIAISIGRRLQMLYYGAAPYGRRIARPVFEREYSSNTVFVYRVTPLPMYSFECHWISTDDFGQFNIFNNIPFEVWIYEGRTLQEFEEHLYGYISVQETYLRRLPSIHAEIARRLNAGDELIIYGYAEDGDDIDGNSRWYSVRTSMDGGNDIGYIHSSFVTITPSVDAEFIYD